MTDEERIREYAKACDNAHSHLEAPLIGRVLTPICKSCVNADYHYGTWDEPECSVFKTMPTEYRRAKKYDCPHYKQISNIGDAYLPEHMRKGKK